MLKILLISSLVSTLVDIKSPQLIEELPNRMIRYLHSTIIAS